MNTKTKQIVCMTMATVLSLTPIMTTPAYAWTWPWSKKEVEVTTLTDAELEEKVESYFFGSLDSSEKEAAEKILKQQDTDKVADLIKNHLDKETGTSYTMDGFPSWLFTKANSAYKKWSELYGESLTADMKKYDEAKDTIDGLDNEIKIIEKKYNGVLDLINLSPYDITSTRRYVLSMDVSKSSVNREYSVWRTYNVDDLFLIGELWGDEACAVLAYTDNYFSEAGAYDMDLIMIPGLTFELNKTGGFVEEIPAYLLVESRSDLKNDRDDYINKNLEKYEILHKYFPAAKVSDDEQSFIDASKVVFGSDWGNSATSDYSNNNTSSYEYNYNTYGTTSTATYPEGVDENTPWYSDEGDFFDYPHEILPQSSDIYLTDADIYFYTPEQLRYAKNEIYARHRRKFSDAELQAWFDAQGDWYVGQVEPSEFKDEWLTDIEKANIQVIQHRIEVNSR